jgi:hypothetical protein
LSFGDESGEGIGVDGVVGEEAGDCIVVAGVKVGVGEEVMLGVSKGIVVGIGALGSGNACELGSVKNGVKFTVPKSKSFLKS